MGESLSAEDAVVLTKHLKSDDEGGSLQLRMKRWSMHLWLLVLLDILMVANFEANFISPRPGTCPGPLWHVWDHQPQSQGEMWTVAHSRAETLSLLLSWPKKMNMYVGLSSCPRMLRTDTWLNWDTRKDFCLFPVLFNFSYFSSDHPLYSFCLTLLFFFFWESWYLVMVLGHEGKNHFLGILLLREHLNTAQSQKTEISQTV